MIKVSDRTYIRCFKVDIIDIEDKASERGMIALIGESYDLCESDIDLIPVDNRTFYKLDYTKLKYECNMVLVRYGDGSFSRYDINGNIDRPDLDYFEYPVYCRVAEAFQRNIDKGDIEEADDEWVDKYAHPSIRG
jgi:hypothetical protein